MIMISTKGRYALRVMADMAQNQGEGYLPLKEIAQRQDISEKYLEGILGTLVRGNFLEGARGKTGGYRLKCNPKECSVWDILSQTETSVAPVACLDDKKNACKRAAICVTLPVWTELDRVIRDYLGSVRLDQLAKKTQKVRGTSGIGKDWNCEL